MRTRSGDIVSSRHSRELASHQLDRLFYRMGIVASIAMLFASAVIILV